MRSATSTSNCRCRRTACCWTASDARRRRWHPDPLAACTTSSDGRPRPAASNTERRSPGTARYVKNAEQALDKASTFFAWLEQGGLAEGLLIAALPAARHDRHRLDADDTSRRWTWRLLSRWRSSSTACWRPSIGELGALLARPRPLRRLVRPRVRLPDPQALEQYLHYVVRASTPTCRTTDSSPSTSPATCCRSLPTPASNESILATGFWFFGEQVHAPVDVRLHQAATGSTTKSTFSARRSSASRSPAPAATTTSSTRSPRRTTTKFFRRAREHAATASPTLTRTAAMAARPADAAARHRVPRRVRPVAPRRRQGGRRHLRAIPPHLARPADRPAAPSKGDVAFEDFEKDRLRRLDRRGHRVRLRPQEEPELLRLSGRRRPAGERFVNRTTATTATPASSRAGRSRSSGGSSAC